VSIRPISLSSPSITTTSRHSLHPLPFFFTALSPPEIYTLSLHDALPILWPPRSPASWALTRAWSIQRLPSSAHCSTTLLATRLRSEENTSELQSLRHLVCRLLLEKKKKK